MIRRALAALACCAVLGCSAAPTLPVPPTVAPTAATTVPADGVLLASLGFQHAPAGFSVPAAATVVERVDQTNTVVAILTAPSGLEIAAYLRRTLPEAGWAITADGNNSLLFERGSLRGAFTVNGPQSALAIRGDRQS